MKDTVSMYLNALRMVPKGGFVPPTRGCSVFKLGWRGIAEAIQIDLKSTVYCSFRS